MRALLVLLLGCAFLFAAACGGSSKKILTLRGEGPSGKIEVEYRVSDEATVTKTVESPWQLDVEVGGDWSVNLVVSNTATSGLVTCALEGETISRAVGTKGEASARCTAAKRGNGIEYETKGERFASSSTAAPIERLPFDFIGAGSAAIDRDWLYIPDGPRVIRYGTKSKQVRRIPSKPDEPGQTVHLGAVVLTPTLVALDAGGTGGGAVYAYVSPGILKVFTHVPEASRVVTVGREFWIAADGGATERMEIVRFSGKNGKVVGRVEGFTGILAVGPESVLVYGYGKGFALLDYHGRVISRGRPPITAFALTGAFLASGKVLVGSAEDDSVLLLDPKRWTATKVSNEFDYVYGDGEGGAVVADKHGRVAAFDVATGKPKGGVTTFEDAYVAAVGRDALWMGTHDGSVYRVARSALG